MTTKRKGNKYSVWVRLAENDKVWRWCSFASSEAAAFERYEEWCEPEFGFGSSIVEVAMFKDIGLFHAAYVDVNKMDQFAVLLRNKKI